MGGSEVETPVAQAETTPASHARPAAPWPPPLGPAGHVRRGGPGPVRRLPAAGADRPGHRGRRVVRAAGLGHAARQRAAAGLDDRGLVVLHHRAPAVRAGGAGPRAERRRRAHRRGDDLYAARARRCAAGQGTRGRTRGRGTDAGRRRDHARAVARDGQLHAAVELRPHRHPGPDAGDLADPGPGPAALVGSGPGGGAAGLGTGRRSPCPVRGSHTAGGGLRDPGVPAARHAAGELVRAVPRGRGHRLGRRRVGRAQADPLPRRVRRPAADRDLRGHRPPCTPTCGSRWRACCCCSARISPASNSARTPPSRWSIWPASRWRCGRPGVPCAGSARRTWWSRSWP